MTAPTTPKRNYTACATLILRRRISSSKLRRSKKVRHLACFDDSDASDAECVRPLERFNACRSFVLRGEYHLQRNARYYHKEAYKANSVRQFVHEYSHPNGA